MVATLIFVMSRQVGRMATNRRVRSTRGPTIQPHFTPPTSAGKLELGRLTHDLHAGLPQRTPGVSAIAWYHEHEMSLPDQHPYPTPDEV